MNQNNKNNMNSNESGLDDKIHEKIGQNKDSGSKYKREKSFFGWIVSHLRQKIQIYWIPEAFNPLKKSSFSYGWIILGGFLLTVGLVVLVCFIFLYFQLKGQYQQLEKNYKIGQPQRSQQLFDWTSLKQQYHNFSQKANAILSLGQANEELPSSQLVIPQDWQGSSVQHLYFQGISKKLEQYTQAFEKAQQYLQAKEQILKSIPSQWPIMHDGGIVIQKFGIQFDQQTGQWKMNNGIKIFDFAGTPVLASADGQVKLIEYDSSEGGYVIVVEHKYGFSSIYRHLSQLKVQIGDQVTKGEVIGAIAAGTDAQGPYLFEKIYLGDQAVNPMDYLLVSFQGDKTHLKNKNGL